MKKNKILFLIVVFIINGKLLSNILPDNRNYDWSNAGIEKNLIFSDTINVLNFGFDNSGVQSNSNLMSQLLNSIDKPTVILFPKGNYFFDTSIMLKSNVSILGENPYTTKFIFNCKDKSDLIVINGTATNIESDIIDNVYKFSNYCLIQKKNFQVRDYVYLYDNDNDKITSDWAKNSTGQILKILKIKNDTIFFYSKLSRNFSLSNNPKIKLIEPIKNVSISNISIIRLDSTSNQTANIKFNYSANCIVSCIQSISCNFAHIDVRYSKNISIIGSYFNNAFSFGGGGRAYGVMLHFASNKCLVYNNIFNKLRHSMIIQAGANGNVFAYNYSREPYWTEVMLPNDAAGDMVCHGNYPYANLFEGNICQNIVIDDSHGKNGPHNTFFRNRAESYGIFMNNNPPSDEQNFIGNEIISNEPLHGLYLLFGNDHFEFGNNVKGNIIPENTENLNEKSLFLTSALDWYNTDEQFPPIGPPNQLAQYNNEAYVRYFNSELVSCNYSETNVLGNNNFKSSIQLYPNPADNKIFLNFSNHQIQRLIIVNNIGQEITPQIINKTENIFTIDISSLATGNYNIIIIAKGIVKPINFIKF